MEWVKQLPTWVKGTIGFFTAIIGFIVLFLDNVYLSITVIIVSLLVASFALCLYVVFSKKQSEILSGRYVYRLPQHRRLALAGLVFLPLLSVALIAIEQTRTIAVIAFAGTATPAATPTQFVDMAARASSTIELISEDYQKDSMLYDLIVQNNSDVQQVLTKIGITSHVSGNFNCLAGGTPLLSAAHYIIRFHVADTETTQKLEPPRTIPPNDVVRFTVSLVPSAIGACSSWSGDITLFVESVDGARVQTQTQSIDEEDVRTLRLINYSREELMDIARNSPDAISRAGAIDQLSGNNTFALGTSVFDNLSEEESDALYALFFEALQDASPSVRYAATSALASFGDTAAVPNIILILQSDEEAYVRYAAARALGRLGDPRAVEALGLALLNDPENDVQFYAASSLGTIGDPNAETYLISAWTNGATSNVVGVIATSLIELRSTRALPLLISEMRKEGDDEHRLTIIRSLRGGEPSYVSSFIPTLADMLAHDSEYVRNTVAFEIRFVTVPGALVSALGKSAMEDSSLQVRLTAVDSLGQIGTSAAIEQLRNIAASQRGKIKQAAEEALEALGQK